MVPLVIPEGVVDRVLEEDPHLLAIFQVELDDGDLVPADARVGVDSPVVGGKVPGKEGVPLLEREDLPELGI